LTTDSAAEKLVFFGNHTFSKAVRSKYQTNESQNIVTNIKAIIEKFSILGDGIVKYIKTLTQKWEKK
jgi:hypothetical protein